MCGLPAVSLAIGLMGTGMSMYGQYQQQESAEAQAEFQSQRAQAQADAQTENAGFIRENAERSFKAGQDTRVERDRARMAHNRRQMAVADKTRQGFAARNVFVDSDSAADEMDLQQKYGSADEATIYDNFERQALGFEQQGDDMIFQSNQMLKGAQQSSLNASYYSSVAGSASNPMAIAASLTAGLSSTFGSYSSMKASGMTPFSGGKTKNFMTAMQKEDRRNFMGATQSSFYGINS